MALTPIERAVFAAAWVEGLGAGSTWVAFNRAAARVLALRQHLGLPGVTSSRMATILRSELRPKAKRRKRK